jgi:hypothetical protein
MTTEATHFVSPFNGPVEIGLRALCVLTTAFPAAYALQRLVVFDYFLVHSDDIEGGPEGLHPRTPHRGGEILVRRGVIQDGLTLYESRGLIERVYKNGGIFFAATDKFADFLDTLMTRPPKTDPSAMRVPTGPGWAEGGFETLDETDTTHP